jgi:hypothetical protein
MDADTEDLIAQLCTRAGILMEDASVMALMIRGLDVAERPARLKKLSAAIATMASLVEAAEALMN